MNNIRKNCDLSEHLKNKLNLIADYTNAKIYYKNPDSLTCYIYTWHPGDQKITLDFDWSANIESASYPSWVCAKLHDKIDRLLPLFDTCHGDNGTNNKAPQDTGRLRNNLKLSREQFLLTLYKGILVGLEKSCMQTNLPERLFHRAAVAMSWRVGMSNYRKRYS